MVNGGSARNAPAYSSRAVTTAAASALVAVRTCPPWTGIACRLESPRTSRTSLDGAAVAGARPHTGTAWGPVGPSAPGTDHVPTDLLLTLPHRSFRDDGLWQRPEREAAQRRWRFCAKCAGLFWRVTFSSYEAPHQPHQPGAQPGADPAMGEFNFALAHDVAEDGPHQGNWRFCGKCSGLFWAGAGGDCPKDHRPHQAGAGPAAPGFDFMLPHDPGEDPLHQQDWRFCQRCFCLVWTGQPDWFAGAHPCLVNTGEHPGLNLPPSPSGRGILLLGFGYNAPAGYRLAGLPLPERGSPRLQDTRYWHGPGEMVCPG